MAAWSTFTCLEKAYPTKEGPQTRWAKRGLLSNPSCLAPPGAAAGLDTLGGAAHPPRRAFQDKDCVRSPKKTHMSHPQPHPPTHPHPHLPHSSVASHGSMIEPRPSSL